MDFEAGYSSLKEVCRNPCCVQLVVCIVYSTADVRILKATIVKTRVRLDTAYTGSCLYFVKL